MRLEAVTLGACLALLGCSGSAAVAPNDFGGQFLLVWEDFDRTYPSFIARSVDWDATRARFEPVAASAGGPRELFDVLAEMLLTLEDGHVTLQGQFGFVQYTGWYDRFPHNNDPGVVRDRYLVGPELSAPGGTVWYGSLEGGPGYIRIPSFGGGSFAEGIEAALDALGDRPALVVDLRDNGGGNDLNGRAVAGRFADRRRLFRRIRYRDGPGHGDFTAPVDDYVEPDGTRYDGPVALLTNRRVFSSAESFVLMMRSFPQVTVVGDTTGGGSANPEEKTLPVGFRYQVPRWIVETPEGETFEGVGIAPDVPVWITPADSAAGRDTILERAVAELAADGAYSYRSATMGSTLEARRAGR